MHICRPDAKTVELAELDPICCELLQQIVPSTEVDDCPAARERLFSSPTQGRERSFEEDWKAYVEPDLSELFRSAQQTVAADLEGFPAEDHEEKTCRLLVPFKNLEAWIHTLNQARLVLVAKHGFTDDELQKGAPVGDHGRFMALLQIEFYGSLQECFLRYLE